MARLIDADVFKERLMANIGLTNCLDRSFKETPTIDAVEVVRCKDCKYFEFDSWAKVNEIPINSKDEKFKKTDFIINVDNYTINIEANSSYNDLFKVKNTSYIMEFVHL